MFPAYLENRMLTRTQERLGALSQADIDAKLSRRFARTPAGPPAGVVDVRKLASNTLEDGYSTDSDKTELFTPDDASPTTADVPFAYGWPNRQWRGLPYSLFEIEVMRHRQLLIDQSRHHLSGRAITFPHDHSLDLLENAHNNVRAFWVGQGIWDPEWGPAWPARQINQSQPRENLPTEAKHGPRLSARWQHEVENSSEKRPVDVRIRRQIATRPLGLFLAQVELERSWLEDDAVWKSDMPGLPEFDLYEVACHNIRKHWHDQGLWRPEWSFLPGLSWAHESIDEDDEPTLHYPDLRFEVEFNNKDARLAPRNEQRVEPRATTRLLYRENPGPGPGLFGHLFQRFKHATIEASTAWQPGSGSQPLIITAESEQLLDKDRKPPSARKARPSPSTKAKQGAKKRTSGPRVAQNGRRKEAKSADQLKPRSAGKVDESRPLRRSPRLRSKQKS